MRLSRGLAPIIILVVISLGIIAGAFYYIKIKPATKTAEPTSQSISSPSPNPEENAFKTETSSPSPSTQKKTTSPSPSPKIASASPASTTTSQIKLDATNLTVSTSCSGYAPKVTFNWNDAQDETGYYLDINDVAWTGPSTPSGWVYAKLNTNTTSYTWDVSRNLEGNDNPVPQNSKTYWWKLRVFNDSTNPYQNKDVYPNSSTPPGNSFTTPYCTPSATSYNLSSEPQADITIKVGQSYGVNALLKDNFGNIVLYQDDFSYSWTQETYKVKVTPTNPCTYGIQPPCPNANGGIVATSVGTDKITVVVKKKSTGQNVASTTFNVTVN